MDAPPDVTAEPTANLDAEPAVDLGDELVAEAAHLEAARAALLAMRERTASLTDAGGDPFSSEALARTLARRMEQLLDDGTVPLFFGRLDFGADGPYAGETFHIGRRHVADPAGDPMVVDWRAPVATAFYRATALAPDGVWRRRRFGAAGGRLTSFEDEHLTAREELGTGSRILAEEIERPRVGPMRDIVATIQPDQDVLVRADLDQSLCVQGAPGTGKTAVGLHRAAYLLFTYRERLRHHGVLVVGPSRAFLSYIAQVLPALGEVDVVQVTPEELVGSVPVRTVDPPDAAWVKGDARMARVLANALAAAVSRPTETLLVTDAGTRLRLGPGELARMVDDLRREGLPYDTARERLARQVAERLRRQREWSGAAPSDRWVARVARSRPVTAWLDAVWPPVDPVRLLTRVLGDRAVLAAAADGVLTAAEQDAVAWPVPPRRAGSVRWSAADAVLLDEAAGLLGRTTGYGHVIVDEAQDLSPMQCRAVARRCRHGSVTVLGDLAQGTGLHAAADWGTQLRHLGKPETTVVPLTTGYRVPREILAFANRLLPRLGVDVAPATSARRAPGALAVRRCAAGAVVEDAVAAVREALAHDGSVAVIAADGDAPALVAGLRDAGVPTGRAGEDESGAERVTVVPATLAKGLEYDHVVVVEPAAIVAAEPRGERRLYVVLTRAVSRLVVVHGRPLPAGLA